MAVEPDETRPLPPIPAIDEPFEPEAILAAMPPELRRLHGAPYGHDEQGRPIDHGSGRIFAGAIRYMQDRVADEVRRSMPPGVDAAELNRRAEWARDVALERLVALLNAAIGNPRLRITSGYLMDANNRYSHEFRLFVAEYGRVLSGDPEFFRNLGRRSIPGPSVMLARPLGIRGTFAVLPRLVGTYVRTDLQVVRTTPRSAIIRWSAASQVEHVAPEVRRHYVRYACRGYQGTFSAIPTAAFGRPPAAVREIACQLRGDPACEWEFTWDGARDRGLLAPARLLGIAASLGVLAFLLARAPGWELVAIVGATLLPAGLILYGGDARRRARELREQQELLVEQRDLAQQEHERSEQARGALQRSNLALEQRLAELMTINDLSVALSTTLDLDELLDRSLRAVVTHLRFDRALVLLADESRGMLGGGRSVGGTDEMVRLVASIDLPLDHPESQLVRLYQADGPMLFRDVDQDAFEGNRQLAAALGVTAFLGTPLVSQGRTVGILAVDNRLSGRDVEPGDGPLLFTVGSLIAGAVQNARLYGEIEAHNRELEGRVADRTAELARATEVAVEAQAAAEAASETKSAFLSNVSHELRTPLTSVVGFTHLIRRRLGEVVFPAVVGSDAKVARAMRQVDDNLAIIVAEGARLTDLINEVLDLAKIEAGRFEWRRLPVRPEALVARAAAATSSLFGPGRVVLATELEADLPIVVGDPDRLLQVLINLLSNAVKFTAEGVVTVRARWGGAGGGSAGASDGPGRGALIVEVADTGVGIAAEDQARIFEPFAQAGDTLTDKPRGTGLGLPICREIVEHHGGRIWLTSETGAGSTFAFSLPVPTDEELRAVDRRGGDRRRTDGVGSRAGREAEAGSEAAGGAGSGAAGGAGAGPSGERRSDRDHREIHPRD